jgi:SAM-dependent methyltransferase
MLRVAMAERRDSKRATRVVSDGYDRIAERYRAWTKDSPARLAFLDLLIGRLEPGSRVIELGCGAGEPVTRRLSELHDVVAVDVSTEQLRLAGEAAPRATLIEADITELDLPAASADAVIAFYAFGHLPPQAHWPVLTKAVSWLRSGGLLVINVPLSAGEGVEPHWLGVPMYFGGIGRQATLDALTEAGLIVERAETVEEDEDGSVVRFL